MKQGIINLKSKKVKAVLVGVVLVLLLILIVPRFSRGAEKPEQGGNTSAAVEAQYPGTGAIQNSDELIGTIEPKNSAYVYPQISGEVLSVSVKTGDSVGAGQVLCTIENNNQTTAKSSVDSARISLEDAKTNMDRTQQMYEAGGVSQETYEQALSAYKSAQVQYDSASSTYSQQVGYSQITAPISGRIESFDIKAHDNVSGQTQICVIAGGQGKIVKFYATEAIAATLKNGDKIQIEKNGTTHQATVSEISTMVDETTGLFEIKADVADGAGLATNASVKVVMVSEKSSGGLTLPLEAVYYDGGNAYVYIYENGKAKKAAVEAGISSDQQIEILSGISAADQVIVTWSSSLRDGAAVTLKGSDEEQVAQTGDEKNTSDGNGGVK